MSRISFQNALISGLLFSSLSWVCCADTLEEQRVRVSGFATLGVVSSNDEDIGFIQNLTQEGVFDGDWSFKSNSNLGFQLDATLNDRFSAAVQLVAMSRVENGLKDSVEWAMLRYRVNPSTTVRIGRLGTNNYMLSDYRNIGFAYLWVRPPTEFYSILAADYVDGLDVAYSIPVGSGTFTGELQYGKNDVKYQRAGETVDVVTDPTWSGALAWENDLWQVQLSMALSEFSDGKYVPGTEPLALALESVGALWPEAIALSESLESEGKRSEYYAFGVAFTPEKWQIQSEISYIDTAVDAFGNFRSGYVSVGRHFDQVTVYGTWAKAKRSRSQDFPAEAPTVGPPFQAALDGIEYGMEFLVNSLHVDQQTASLGVRWNLLYNLAAKAQWDHSQVAAFGAGFWDQKVVPEKDKTVNTLTINLNYVF